MSTRVFSGPTTPFRAVVRVPGDKSLAHRALLLSSMSRAPSRIANLPPGRDVATTARALRGLGVDVDIRADGSAHVGPRTDWRTPSGPIECENSGTTMRLLTGALAGLPFDSVLVGDSSLSTRPMQRLVAPLGELGASIRTTDGLPPIFVAGRPLTGADVVIDVPSAQVRSAVILAALRSDGPSSIDSPPGFRDHTERWLQALGLGRWLSPTRFEVSPAPVPALDVSLPADPSSAAFLWAAAAIAPGSEITTPGVSLNPGRLGLLSVLRSMGARVSSIPTGQVLGDPVGDVTVAHGPLRGSLVSGPTVVACIDELPLVGLLAAFADGETIVADAVELRTKESDRIVATVDLIRCIGARAQATPDGFVVTGGRPLGGRIDAGGDHRIAMAGAVAASAGSRVAVQGFEASAVSWPGFGDALEVVWSSR